MTREEAIRRLKNMAWLYGSAEREQNIEAIDMAIEALSVANLKEEFELADAVPTETSTLGEKHQLSHGRLIDADELKKHLDGAWEELNDDGERKGVRLARWYLISAPTVDSTIDVVRCKDCIHWQKTNIETTDGEPFYDCPFCGEWADANGFCSFGERSEE